MVAVSLKKSSFFDAPIDLVNACRIHNTPEYLKIGIIDERKIVVNFAKLFQYFAPIVLGMISEKSKIIIVITVETNPTRTSSEIPVGKNVFSRFNSEYATLA